MKTYKRYSNRKYYDGTKAGYANIDDILLHYRSGEPLKVVCYVTKRDVTEDTITELILRAADRQVGSNSKLSLPVRGLLGLLQLVPTVDRATPGQLSFREKKAARMAMLQKDVAERTDSC